MKIARQAVECIDYMGSDLSVVNAARVSFAKESDYEYAEISTDTTGEAIYVYANGDTDKTHYQRVKEQDKKLINYLAKHNHWSPFAHAFLSFRCKAPIFIARQLAKHQVGLSWNEVSRRYVDEEPEFFFPEEWRGRPVNAKQGRDGVVDISDCHVEFYNGHSLLGVSDVTQFSLQMYQSLLDAGVAPEQARMVLPQNTMSEWIWSGSLMEFIRVIKQRLDPHAQKEVQEVAELLSREVQLRFPVSYAALMDCEQNEQ